MTFLTMTFKKLVRFIIAIALSTAAWTTSAENNSETIPVLTTPHNAIRTNSAAALSASNMADQPFIFRTGFNSATRSGYLKKYSMVQQHNNLTISGNAQWDAGTLLTTSQTPEQRSVFTYHDETKQTIAFELDQFPSEIRAVFHLSPSTGINDNSGAKRVAWLKGVRELEGNHTNPKAPKFRVRESILGEIIHSAPVYVGAPQKNSIGANYATFYEQHKTRPGTVYVGANDGMLHAFSADTGRELFAYIPGMLLTKLPALTDPDSSHELTMDSNIHVAEAQVAGLWKTVLAAGMGLGAKGVFALDVTSPDQFRQGKRTLFEFTEKDDADIGFVTSTPVITKISTGKNKDGTVKYAYFVVVASGYNAVNTNNGKSFLFLLSLDKNPATPWMLNSNYYKLSANSHETNLLTTPGLVINAQQAASYAYAGDLQGNLWRFDFTKNNLAFTPSKVIFTAKDKNNIPQSITAQPVVSNGPEGGYLILFGAGNQPDQTTGANNTSRSNSFYAIYDSPQQQDYFITDRSQLARREFITATIKGETGYKVAGDNFTYGNSSSDKKGWYADFLNKNQHCEEQCVSAGLIAYGSIFFNTIIPKTPSCNGVETGVYYRLNTISGKTDTPDGITGIESQAGLPGAPWLVTTQAFQGERDSIGRRNNTHHFSVLNFGTGGMKGTSEVINSGGVILKAGRLSWREIANWQDK